MRLGLGYVKGVARAPRAPSAGRRARARRPLSQPRRARRPRRRRAARRSSSSPGRAPATASGDDGRGRRSALWQLGLVAACPRRERARRAQGTQLALPLELPAAPRLRPLGRWQRLIADYSTSGVTVGDHAIAILRGRLTVPMLATSAQLARLPSGGEVAVAGLVIARQRPGTAHGTMFLLFEDEFGTVNLIVPQGGLRAPPPARPRRAAAAGEGAPGALPRSRPRRPSDAASAPTRRAARAEHGGDPPGDQRDRARARPLERFLPGGIDEADAPLAARVRRLRRAARRRRAGAGRARSAARGGGRLEHARRRAPRAELRLAGGAR